MFLNVCKQAFHISHVCISKRKGHFTVKSYVSMLFSFKGKVLVDFQICISVSLNGDNTDIEKPDGGMFTYFVVDGLFRIIFAHINLLYQRFKICINAKWFFIRLLIKLYHLNGIRRDYIVTKIFVFTYFYMWLKSVFCSKEWRQFKQ